MHFRLILYRIASPTRMKVDSGFITLLLMSMCRCFRCFDTSERYSRVVEAEQYKHFKVKSEGPFRIELQSVTGDADVYVSDETPTPTFDNYVLKSTTCGTDIIHVPSSFKRPVHIAVYGHFIFEQSEFVMQVVPEEEEFDWFKENVYPQTEEHGDSRRAGARPPPSPKADEEESILWTIFIGILKIVFDILV